MNSSLAQARIPKPVNKRIDTKTVILDTAEHLFANNSFASVSIRQITSEAGVSLASVNYHFGSKDKLLVAVFMRRVSAFNKERVHLLREAEENAGGGMTVREILYALVAPTVRWLLQPDMRDFMRFLARARAEGHRELQDLLNRDVAHLQRFVLPLAQAMPHLPPEEIYWRLLFTLSVEHTVYTDLQRIEAISGGVCDPADIEKLVTRIIDYVVAGFEAPVNRELMRGASTTVARK